MAKVLLTKPIRWFQEGRCYPDYVGYSSLGFCVSGFYDFDFTTGATSADIDEIPDDCVFMLTSNFKLPDPTKKMRPHAYNFWLNRKGYAFIRPRLVAMIEQHHPGFRDGTGPLTIDSIDAIFEKFIVPYEEKAAMNKKIAAAIGKTYYCGL